MSRQYRSTIPGSGLGIVIFLTIFLFGLVPSAKSNQIPSTLSSVYQADELQAQSTLQPATIVDIIITEQGLSPSSLTIPFGATIRWINQSNQTQLIEGSYLDLSLAAGLDTQTIFLPLIVHNSSKNQVSATVSEDIEIEDDQLPASDLAEEVISWQSGDIAPGSSFSRIFDQPGYHKYASINSPELVGIIIVESPPAFLAASSMALPVSTTVDDHTDNGNCTLREALIAANTDKAVDACPPGNGADTILLESGTYSLTVTGRGENRAESGDLDVRGPVTIIGAGADLTIIDAGALDDRVFQILGWGNLTLSGVTITNGQLNRGSGVFNRGVLTLNNSNLIGNTANRSGGGLTNEGQATLNNSTVSGNFARDVGGGIHNLGVLVLNSSTISNNTAKREYGGGIYNLGTLILNNSTVSGNTAGSDGGGIKNEATLILNNSTITNNTADNDGGGIKNYEDGTVNFQNTIIAGNSAHELEDADCHELDGGSLGHNLVGHDTGCPTLETDLTVEPDDVFSLVLGPLQDNGGPTETHALLSDSPAIDAGDPDGCEGSAGSFTTDQRGEPRPVDGDGDGIDRCDIGSYEAQPADPAQLGPIFTVNTRELTDDGVCKVSRCTLAEAIEAANARDNDESPDVIQFAITDPSPFTIAPTAGLTIPVVTDPVIIDGTTQTGATCDPLSPIITLDGSSAGPEVDGLTISAGNSTVRGLAITGFSRNGIALNTLGNNKVECTIISLNNGNGIHVADDAGNTLLGNRIFDNGQLGINLGSEGVTQNDANDPDLGGNNLQNFPVIVAAVPDNSSVIIEGGINSTPDTMITLEFFANSSCDQTGFGEGQTFLGLHTVTTNENGNATFEELAFPLADSEGQFITATATDADGNTSEFSQCAPVDFDNTSWPQALRLTPGGDTSPAVIDQKLDKIGQSRWYKFSVDPNSQVIVTLTNLPANYDLTVYKDIAQAFNDLNSSEDLLRLGAEFAPDAVARGARSPDALARGARSPDAFATNAFSPDAIARGARSPDAIARGARSPDGFAPDAFSPDVYAPDAFARGARSEDDFARGARSPEAYASAQTRSLIGISAFDGTAGEGVILNTWNNTGDFYVRVRGRDGAFNLTQAFHLEVTLLGELCNGISADGLPATSLSPASDPNSDGNRRTLILTDLTRMTDTPVASLTTFAQLSEIMGVMVNVGADNRVIAANQQADNNPSCPYAKNLVADAVKRVVNRYREANPSLEYIVIAGNDNVIPFFRYPDTALLGPESDYFPPVLDFTTSEASLRLSFILGQDEYGSQMEISLKESVLPIPDLPVGRLVETQADIIRILEAYDQTDNGVVRPGSALVTGYDFFADAADSIQAELEAGLEAGAAVDSLITDRDVSPLDPLAWTADQLRAQLFGNRHDLVFLGGHFSASSALAADYETRLLASELAGSSENLFENAIIYSIGCHSGYNIVNEHDIPGLTREPDWAQAFAQQGATLIAGTGYQYGDTDIIEYSERIYLEFSRQLRTGTGPVPIGRALMTAKQLFLAQTPQLRELHEKSLLEATIFGLPMISVDLPNRRSAPSDGVSVVTSVEPFTTGTGAALGLGYFDYTLDPTIIQTSVELTDIEDGSTVEAIRLASPGPDGEPRSMSNLGEPILPLELINVSGPTDLVLRGVGFRGGDYSDILNILPVTGAPATEIRNIHTPFFSTVFFPIKPWNINYFDALAAGPGGATQLAVTPAQFRSSSIGSETNTLREFDNMNFRFYFSNDLSDAALAAAPSIVGISAIPEAGNVNFGINVVGDPAAGIQEVWISYTAISGAFSGSWRTLSLSQNTAETSLWEGVLDLEGADPLNVRYIVQAVNGVGLVSMATNVGAFYIPGVDPSAPSQATALSLEIPATSGAFGNDAILSALLTSNGTPLVNQLVMFGIGTVSSFGITDENGRATATVPLLDLPNQYPVNAAFGGAAGFAPSSAAGTFNITIQDTTLNLAEPEEDLDALQVATLADVAGRRLFEKTVIFVITNPETNEVVYRESIITDYIGRAALLTVPLAPGVYNVSVTFDDPSGAYNSSTASNTLAIPTGVLTIIKEVVGGEPTNDWQFSGSGEIGAFSLPPDGGEQRFEGLTAGSYTIEETPRFGYSAEVTCSDGTTGLGSVTIDLGGQDLSCTFRNVLQICDNILDDFNRSGPNLGSNWAGAQSKGQYRIIDNSFVEVDSGGAAYWKSPNFGSDQEACLTLTQIDSDAHHSVLLKVQQNWNQGAIDVFYNTENDEPVIGIETYQRNIGWTTLATFPMELQPGDQLAGQALNDGTVRVFVNGNFVGEANAGPFFAGKGGRIGMWFFGSGQPNARLDDFAGK